MNLEKVPLPKTDTSFEKKYKIIIRPDNFRDYWRDVWHFREILYILAHRDIVVRYKQTILGLVWAFFKPLLSMVAFTIVFGKIAKLPSNDIPYPVLVLSGLLPWYFFSNTLSEMSNSIVNNQSMVSKIYFPRLLLPLSIIGVGVVDVGISILLLFSLMLFYGMTFHITILLLPFFIVLAVYSCLGLGLFFSALNVQFRDVKIVIPFFLQFGLYISPVGFASTIVPERWQFLYSLNPMVGVIEGFRWCVSGGGIPVYCQGMMASLLLTTLMLLFGVRYFRSVERTFADVI